MNKPITEANRQKLGNMLHSLENVHNTVPLVMKTAFNSKGRKSPQIAYQAIKALTNENDRIYDPFMGAGSFVIAAAEANRRIDATELDNYAYSAVHALLAKINAAKARRLFAAVEAEAKAAVMDLYETQCCGVKNYISKLYFDPEPQEYFSPLPHREIRDGKNVKFVSPCPICRSKAKKFDRTDADKLKEISRIDVSDFPKDKYIENSRINITASAGADHYDRIFTRRNQKALLLIQDAILKLEPCIERDILEQALVSSLSLARTCMYGSSSDILYQVIRYKGQEMNVWLLFESKFKSFLKFKKDYRHILAKSPQQDDKYRIFQASYQEFCRDRVPDGTYDLIYTDFPYTDQIPSLERNQLYRIWLNRFYDRGSFELTDQMLAEEIILTDSRERPAKRKPEQYYADIDQLFHTFYRILKEHSLVVLTVKLGKNKYFTTLMKIINLARKNGFELARSIGIDKNDPTLRKQSAHKNTLSKEMLIAFESLSQEDRYWYIKDKNYEFETVRLVYELLKREKPTLTEAVRHVRDSIINTEEYFPTEEDLQTIRKIIADSFFIQPETSLVWTDYRKLYLDIEDSTDLFSKLYAYIPIMIRQLLEEKGEFVLDDLYFKIANTLCTGDPNTINQFLEDSSHAAAISRLIDSCCSSDGRVYRKKNYSVPLQSEAIDIAALSGGEFEQLIKRLLEADGFYNVFVIGGAGDLGVDLIGTKLGPDGMPRTYLFQCKRWSSKVFSEPLQRLVAERERRKADYAVCVTTSDYTRDGQKISRQQNVEAWNGEDVARMLDLYFPGQYYNSMIGAKSWISSIKA